MNHSEVIQAYYFSSKRKKEKKRKEKRGLLGNSMLPYNRGKWHGVRLTLRKTHRWGNSPLLFYYYYYCCYRWCYYYCLKCIIIFLLLYGRYICTILLGRVLGSMLGESDNPKEELPSQLWLLKQVISHQSSRWGPGYNLRWEGMCVYVYI